jgi:hypothetical protein
VSQIENSSSEHRFARLRSALRTRAEPHSSEATPPDIEQQPDNIGEPEADSFRLTTISDIDQSPSLDLHRTQSAPTQPPGEFEKVATQLKLLGLCIILLLLSPVIAIGLYFLVVGN